MSKDSPLFKAFSGAQLVLTLLASILSPVAISAFTYAKTTTALDAKIDASAAQMRLEREQGFVKKDEFKEMSNDIKLMRDDVTRIKALLERGRH
jgi:predicted S18 family serine protease